MKKNVFMGLLIASNLFAINNIYASCANYLSNNDTWVETLYYPNVGAGLETCVYMDSRSGAVVFTELGRPTNIGNYSAVTSAVQGTAEYCMSSDAANCN